MNNIYLKISMRIIVLFITAILLSFIPDLNPDLFGDWQCKGTADLVTNSTYGWTRTIGCQYASRGDHDPTWHWGYRHWLYFFMGLCLAVIQIAAGVESVIKYNNEKVS